MLLAPDDVPLHRDSVGAMGLGIGSQMPARVVKPYVYRGTGEDQFPETPPPPRKRPPRLSQNRKKAKPPRKRYRRETYVYTPPKYTPPPEPDPEPWTDPVLNIPIARPLRPSPGWRPTTGEDLADLLEGLEAR